MSTPVTFNTLDSTVLELERLHWQIAYPNYKAGSSVPPPAHLASIVPYEMRDGGHHRNLVFSVTESSTATVKSPLPVVATIGSNYTQLNSNETAAKFPTDCKDSDNETRKMKDRIRQMNITGLEGDFHLLMVNLVPWLTRKCWTELARGQRPALLKDPTFGGYSAIISRSEHHLAHAGIRPAAWIGHGAQPTLRHALMHVLKNLPSERYVCNNLVYWGPIKLERL